MTFPWLIALRYLRMQAKRSSKVHRVTLVLGLLLAAAFVATFLLDHARSLKWQEVRLHYGNLLHLIRLTLIVCFVLVETFILLVRRLTIFTTISTFGLFLGSGALVIVLSVMSGFETDLKQKILGTHAHVVVTMNDEPFTNYRQAAARTAALPDVAAVTPFISNEVMIASASNLSGVVLKGIDPPTVGRVTDLVRNLGVGGLDYLEHPEKLRGLGGPPLLKPEEDEPEPSPRPGAPHFRSAPQGSLHGAEAKAGDSPEPRRVLPGVIVGQELAKNLRLYLGDDVNIVSPLGGIGPQGAMPKSKPFRVAGIFFSGMFEYDTKYIYVAIPAAQRFLGLGDEVTGLELKVKDPDRSGPVAEAIKGALGPTFEVQDWKELNRSLFSALKLEKIAMFVVLCFIILVAAFSIIATGIMLVMEKGREVAILKSMGATDRGILTVFLILGLYMGTLGTLSGIAVGIVACLALGRWGLQLDPEVYYITQLPVKMNPYEIASVFAAALLITLLATLYPAWIAARLRPVVALREGHG